MQCLLTNRMNCGSHKANINKVGICGCLKINIFILSGCGRNLNPHHRMMMPLSAELK